jgi:predicted Zn-dependent protease
MLQKDPTDYTSKFALAQAYSWAKQYDQAILLMNELVAQTDDLDVKVQLANVYLWNKQPKQAAALLEKMVQEYPDNLSVQMLFGTALYYAGESERASHVFERIVTEQNKDTR